MAERERLPLAPIDTSAVERFWSRFVAGSAEFAEASYVEAFQFGDDQALADELVDLVANGPKRATADIVAGLEASGDNRPQVGDLWVACRGDGSPAVVIRTTEVRVGPLSSVDEQFAWDEGEGDRTRADWLKNHHAFFNREYERLGLEMHDDIAVVFERFELLHVG